MSANLLITGATGFTGTLFCQQLAHAQPETTATILVRPKSDRTPLMALNLCLSYEIGDGSEAATWTRLIADHQPNTIIHIASIRHVPALLAALQQHPQTPRLIVVGTTGVYSQYNQYAAGYRQIEAQLADYSGSHCLLRPTMIYGSARDKNLHKLIQFCDRYHSFPVFGSGRSLLQPVHADDLAEAILTAYQRPQVTGAYDLSGGSVVSFRELLALISRLLDKPVRPIPLPLRASAIAAGLLETLLGRRSPIRREQILRLQEDKAYPHDAAHRDLDFAPRSLAAGLQAEIAQLRA
ncbi:MAG: NAD-dependent epimerase/dehydratase family protein [Spirulinaceae cyanobacterium SM2_1_0]|nr:NAD-dependent epimerase/dehydratase family protein [Spirulinaceae cyanobacterium SM2_1_0]